MTNSNCQSSCMSNWELKTPILFLIFNRPDTTQMVFNEIRRAKPKKLFISADGPRENKPGEVEKCLAARDFVLKGIDWDCEIFTNFRDRNLGCKLAVSSGIDWFFENVEEGIILEDDTLPHPTFFRFCEKLLERYWDDKRIMMITGTNYFIEMKHIEESYFFSKHFSIWGWATWRRTWKLYDMKMALWEKFKQEGHLKYLTNKWYIQKHFKDTFDLILYNKMDTWDIQWVFCCLFNSGLSIVPKTNLVSNIGKYGTHSGGVTDVHFLKIIPMDTEDLIHPRMVFENRFYDETLHKLKTRPAVIKKVFINALKPFLKKIGLLDIAKFVYKKF